MECSWNFHQLLLQRVHIDSTAAIGIVSSGPDWLWQAQYGPHSSVAAENSQSLLITLVSFPRERCQCVRRFQADPCCRRPRKMPTKSIRYCEICKKVATVARTPHRPKKGQVATSAAKYLSFTSNPHQTFLFLSQSSTLPFSPTNLIVTFAAFIFLLLEGSVYCTPYLLRQSQRD